MGAVIIMGALICYPQMMARSWLTYSRWCEVGCAIPSLHCQLLYQVAVIRCSGDVVASHVLLALTLLLVKKGNAFLKFLSCFILCLDMLVLFSDDTLWRQLWASVQEVRGSGRVLGAGLGTQSLLALLSTKVISQLVLKGALLLSPGGALLTGRANFDNFWESTNNIIRTWLYQVFTWS